MCIRDSPWSATPSTPRQRRCNPNAMPRRMRALLSRAFSFASDGANASARAPHRPCTSAPSD
eukprot:4797568-Pyramimonas_sp.AAC.1